jgi:hypothetical protein
VQIAVAARLLECLGLGQRPGNVTAQFEFTLAAIAQNLRRLVKLLAQPPPIMLTLAARPIGSR